MSATSHPNYERYLRGAFPCTKEAMEKAPQKGAVRIYAAHFDPSLFETTHIHHPKGDRVTRAYDTVDLHPKGRSQCYVHFVSAPFYANPAQFTYTTHGDLMGKFAKDVPNPKEFSWPLNYAGLDRLRLMEVLEANPHLFKEYADGTNPTVPRLIIKGSGGSGSESKTEGHSLSRTVRITIRDGYLESDRDGPIYRSLVQTFQGSNLAADFLVCGAIRASDPVKGVERHKEADFEDMVQRNKLSMADLATAPFNDPRMQALIAEIRRKDKPFAQDMSASSQQMVDGKMKTVFSKKDKMPNTAWFEASEVAVYESGNMPESDRAAAMATPDPPVLCINGKRVGLIRHLLDEGCSFKPIRVLRMQINRHSDGSLKPEYVRVPPAEADKLIEAMGADAIISLIYDIQYRPNRNTTFAGGMKVTIQGIIIHGKGKSPHAQSIDAPTAVNGMTQEEMEDMMLHQQMIDAELAAAKKRKPPQGEQPEADKIPRLEPAPTPAPDTGSSSSNIGSSVAEGPLPPFTPSGSPGYPDEFG